jgi:hypothetical protein
MLGLGLSGVRAVRISPRSRSDRPGRRLRSSPSDPNAISTPSRLGFAGTAERMVDGERRRDPSSHAASRRFPVVTRSHPFSRSRGLSRRRSRVRVPSLPYETRPQTAARRAAVLERSWNAAAATGAERRQGQNRESPATGDQRRPLRMRGKARRGLSRGGRGFESRRSHSQFACNRADSLP